MISNGLQSIFSILIMISIGMILTHKNWFDKNITIIFTKIIVNLSIPSLIIFNLITSYTKEDLIELFGSIIVPIMGITISYILSSLISIIFNIKKERRGLFRALFTFSNTIMVGLPVNIALFGDKSIPVVTIYYLANTTVFWTLGIYGIRKAEKKEGKPYNEFLQIRKIFSPPLIAFILVMIFIFLNVSLPRFILSPLGYIGDLTTPLSMLVIGINSYSVKFQKNFINKESLIILLGKFVIVPLVLFLLLKSLSKPDLMTKVFIIESGMPIMATVSIVGQRYSNVDSNYATVLHCF